MWMQSPTREPNAGLGRRGKKRDMIVRRNSLPHLVSIYWKGGKLRNVQSQGYEINKEAENVLEGSLRFCKKIDGIYYFMKRRSYSKCCWK